MHINDLDKEFSSTEASRESPPPTVRPPAVPSERRSHWAGLAQPARQGAALTGGPNGSSLGKKRKLGRSD